MENSFYYFFSATPQVLGGLLALFGVFVLFKLQNLNVELTSMASRIVEFIQNYPKDNISENEGNNRNILCSSVNEYIQTKNLNLIKYSLELNSDPFITENPFYKFQIESFNTLYTLHKRLKVETIKSSVFTAIVIFFSLGIIPFGEWLICHPSNLNIIFLVFILCIGISLYKLISLLKESFK
jgi:hypothetical protein